MFLLKKFFQRIKCQLAILHSLRACYEFVAFAIPSFCLCSQADIRMGLGRELQRTYNVPTADSPWLAQKPLYGIFHFFY